MRELILTQRAYRDKCPTLELRNADGCIVFGIIRVHESRVPAERAGSVK